MNHWIYLCQLIALRYRLVMVNRLLGTKRWDRYRCSRCHAVRTVEA